MNVNRLKLSVETETEFTKTCTIIDYYETKRILKALNETLLSGVEVDKIVKNLKTLQKILYNYEGE